MTLDINRQTYFGILYFFCSVFINRGDQEIGVVYILYSNKIGIIHK